MPTVIWKKRENEVTSVFSEPCELKREKQLYRRAGAASAWLCIRVSKVDGVLTILGLVVLYVLKAPRVPVMFSRGVVIHAWVIFWMPASSCGGSWRM